MRTTDKMVKIMSEEKTLIRLFKTDKGLILRRTLKDVKNNEYSYLILMLEQELVEMKEIFYKRVLKNE